MVPGLAALEDASVPPGKLQAYANGFAPQFATVGVGVILAVPHDVANPGRFTVGGCLTTTVRVKKKVPQGFVAASRMR